MTTTERTLPRPQCLTVTGLVAAALLMTGSQALAAPGYLTTWSDLYPDSASDDNAGCQICHANDTGDINPYGFEVAECSGATGTITARIQAAEGADSDGQGDSNITEINASTQPGWTSPDVPVFTRGGCAPAGTDTYAGAGDVDPGVVNQPPVADANGPYSGTVGVAVTFDGSASSDPDGTIVSYEWDFGDGNTGTGVSPTHTYTLDGIYTVTLTVTDDAGATDTASTTATIVPLGNLPPVADPNGPYNGTAGVTLTLDGSGSSDPDGTIVAYDWSFGDGNTGTGVTPTHVYAAAGTFTVSLTVTDDAGDTDTGTTTANIVPEPQDPVADPNGPYNGIEGQPVAFDGSASFDPDGGNITQYDWDFGDGNTGTGVSPTHTYAAAGAYTVTLTVVDDEGAISAPAATTATIDTATVDLDIAQFRVTKRVRLARVKPVGIQLTVKNNGLVDGSAPATVTGTQNGTVVYNETVTVTDGVGNGRTKFDFPPFVPTDAGDITWTATIADGDPDDDTASATTTVVP